MAVHSRVITGRCSKRRPVVLTSIGRVWIWPRRLQARAKATSSINGMAGKPPASSKTSRRTAYAWSPYGRPKPTERRSNRRNQALARRPAAGLLGSVWRRKQARATSRSSRVLPATSDHPSGRRQSACRKSSRGADVARAPWASCPPRPGGQERTRTPVMASALATVSSLLPPSTTTTSAASGPMEPRQAPIRAASSRAGITTANPLVSTERIVHLRVPEGAIYCGLELEKVFTSRLRTERS